MHLHKAYNYKPRLRRLALLLPGAPAYFARRARAANYAELRIAGPLDDASLAPVKHIRDADPLAERWERWVAAMLRALDDEDAREIPHGVLDAGETDDVETEEAPVWVF
ncbi:hypothetical protein CC85DRAFT_305490 [Cutaneotrichosporon oleaginosum]|uniref:Uncharacterized protein n=1 Tax=Cutaneotrichosporon oleaginosum TaxID=879819 RepID=A0A0J0XCZ5_9TREE|nr:uncharacterized protein CC85DRAFT_305490 [Cutaneotrichosporon oleaginosum]KLT38935.1 hypothetical protein CC85DRAFT_305490 [Cutaneotrichosporon oleaginosum]